MSPRSLRCVLASLVLLVATGAYADSASRSPSPIPVPSATVVAPSASAPAPDQPPAAPTVASAEKPPLALPPPPMPQRKEFPDLTPEIAAKLSPEQLTDIFIAHEHAENGGLTAVVGGISLFTFLLGSVLGICYVVFRVIRMRHQTLQAAMEKGLVTPEMLAPVPSERLDQRRGILLTLGGVGLSVFAFFSPFDMFAGIGALPALIGVGYLISWWIAHGRATDEAASHPSGSGSSLSSSASGAE